MPHRQVAMLIALLASVSACGARSDADYVYWLGEFSRAQSVRSSPPDPRSAEWEWAIDFFLENPGVVARVRGRAGEAVKVQYSDESEARAVYEYIDSSNPIDVRVAYPTLYVYWQEGSVNTAHYLAVFDLAARQAILKRRVNPADMPLVKAEHGAG